MAALNVRVSERARVKRGVRGFLLSSDSTTHMVTTQLPTSCAVTALPSPAVALAATQSTARGELMNCCVLSYLEPRGSARAECGPTPRSPSVSWNRCRCEGILCVHTSILSPDRSTRGSGLCEKMGECRSVNMNYREGDIGVGDAQQYGCPTDMSRCSVIT